MHTITWYGHAAFLLTWHDTRILIDPFLTGNPSFSGSWAEMPAPTAVFVTHSHGDHLGDAVSICKATGAKLGAIVEIAEECHKQGVPTPQILNGIGFNIGGTVKVDDIAVTMTEAFHSSVGMPCGFIFTLPDGRSIYHAGDTGIFFNMATWGKLYQIDYALLPTGGTFTMDTRQAALACGLLKAKNLIPMHWGTFPMLAQNMDDLPALLAECAPECALQLLEIGVPHQLAPCASGCCH